MIYERISPLLSARINKNEIKPKKKKYSRSNITVAILEEENERRIALNKSYKMPKRKPTPKADRNIESCSDWGTEYISGTPLIKSYRFFR